MNTQQQKEGLILSNEETMSNLEVWTELNRTVGELKKGDSIWDMRGKVHLVGSKDNKKNGMISLATAKKMYAKQQVKKICTDEEVFTLATPLTSTNMLVSDMEQDILYEILADSDYSNDTTIFSLKGLTVSTTFRGNDFDEDEFSFWFNLSIINQLEYGDGINVETMNLSQLETLSVEVYNQVDLKRYSRKIR